MGDFRLGCKELAVACPGGAGADAVCGPGG